MSQFLVVYLVGRSENSVRAFRRGAAVASVLPRAVKLARYGLCVRPRPTGGRVRQSCGGGPGAGRPWRGAGRRAPGAGRMARRLPPAGAREVGGVSADCPCGRAGWGSERRAGASAGCRFCAGFCGLRAGLGRRVGAGRGSDTPKLPDGATLVGVTQGVERSRDAVEKVSRHDGATPPLFGATLPGGTAGTLTTRRERAWHTEEGPGSNGRHSG